MKNKVLSFLVGGLFIIDIIFIIVFFAFKNNKIKTAKDIYSDSSLSVVELKTSKDDNVSYGTAVIIDDLGTLVSNAHMVVYKQAGVYNEFAKFEIRFSYEEDYREVNLINYDIDNDLAFLRIIDLSNIKFKSIKIGDNTKCLTGEKVYAVGNGMNHGIGITEGIISICAINIEYEGNVREMIQCDLTINEGNSGGALLDKNGKLIGITTFRLKDNLGNIIYGVAFAIPITTVKYYYNNL